jgi:two-component system CheB/CheR fusion protein
MAAKRRPEPAKARSEGKAERVLPPIAGVGASAGGLEAFTELLADLPADLDLALVLIQHLQPGHPSLLPRLLQKITALQVEEARDGTVPEAGRVYVMPSEKYLVLSGGKLRLVERHGEPSGLKMPIDLFLRSLAEERKAGAIGVVLSGTAADGTQGLLAIKGEAGICFAQSESSAEYGGMPRSAIEAGCVDFILPPAAIARELARIAHHPYFAAAARARAPEATVLPARDRAYHGVLNLVRDQTGVDFSQYRPSTIGRRLARRMAVRSRVSLADYFLYLRKHPGEISLLFEDLLIPATRFFRDPEVFDHLRANVVAKLVRERRPPNRPIRIWSVGCASGEEAYSLAMLGLEAQGAHGEAGTLQVFGTDLSESAIRRARVGRYPADIVKDVSPARLQRFFNTADHGYRVAKAVRDVCIFAQHNVARDAPFSHVDIVACRNLMIYMEPELQQRIFPILHYALNPGGTLVLGSAESANGQGELFRPIGDGTVQRKLKLYEALPAGKAPYFEFIGGRGFGAVPAVTGVVAMARSADEDARKEADRIILNQFAPAGVVVDADLEVVEFRGRTSRFLEPTPGAASLNLLRIVRGNLGAYVRDMVQKSRKTGMPIRHEGLPGGVHGGVRREINLYVMPLRATRAQGGSGRREFFLVLFKPVTRVLPAAAAGKGAGSPGLELERMRRSLSESQALVRSFSEEYQAAKQEYQAATEEIASANEELQSSNEELETSKEELQSANEEISTINEELRHRNAELHQSNADMQNLIAVADFAVILLDRELRIRRYSPAAERIFGLIAADTGRRIGDLRGSIGTAEIESLALGAIAAGTGQRKQTRDAAGRWYELRVNPYFTAERKIDGVVLVLADIDALKRTIAELAAALTRAALNPVALLAQNLNVLHANEAFQQQVGVPKGAVWAASPLAAAIEHAHAGGAIVFDLPLEGRVRRAKLERIPGESEVLWVVSLST